MSEKKEAKKRLHEIVATIRYAVVVEADSEAEALDHVKTWEDAWHTTGEMVGVVDMEVIDVREGISEEAHVTVSKVGPKP